MSEADERLGRLIAALTLRLEFKPQDCWIGVFWRTTPKANWMQRIDVWICVVPMLPMHISWLRRMAEARAALEEASDARS